MTKKHFEAAAAYVRAYRAEIGMDADMPSVPEEAFIALFRQFSPRFDVERFRNACRGQDATDSAGRTVRYGVRS